MWKTTPNWWITHADVIIKCTSKKQLFIQIHFLSQLRQVPKPLMSWSHNVVCNRACSVRSHSRGCLPDTLKYLLEKHSACYWAVPDSVCSHSFSGVWGGLETPAPLTSARVTRLEPSSRFWNTDNDREQETRRHCQALCHKPYHVVRELQKLFGLLFI